MNFYMQKAYNSRWYLSSLSMSVCGPACSQQRHQHLHGLVVRMYLLRAGWELGLEAGVRTPVWQAKRDLLRPGCIYLTLCAYVCVCLWVHTHLWHSLSVLTLGTGCGEWGQVEEDDLRKGWQSIVIAFPGEYSGIGDDWVRVMEGILIWGAKETWPRILVPNISIYLLLHLSSYHSINHPSLHIFITMHVLSISLPPSIHLSSYLPVIYLSVYLYLSVFYSCLSTYLSIIHLSIYIYIYII